MLTYAIIVFAVAALGGLLLASFVLRGKLAPWAVSLLHAALGAIGLLRRYRPVSRAQRWPR